MHLYCNEKLQFVRMMQMDFLGNDSTRSMGQLFFFCEEAGRAVQKLLGVALSPLKPT